MAQDIPYVNQFLKTSITESKGVLHDLFRSPRPMKTREGETPGEPLIASNSARGDNPLDCPMARPPKTRIFIGALH